MHAFLQVAQLICLLALLTLVGFFCWPIFTAWLEKRGIKKRVATKTYERDDEAVQDVKKAQIANLQFLGLPSVHAGQTVWNVPVLNPEQTGEWQKNRQVLTAARISAMMKQGEIPMDMVELQGGYVLIASNGKTFLMTKLNLTTSEETALEKERMEAVQKGDPMIPNFQGLAWKISRACGDHKPRFPGEKAKSTIQVLSIHPELGQKGLVSFLPPNLLNRKEHEYYDMAAREIDGARIMIFMHAGGSWTCFMGRELKWEETHELRAM